MARGPQFDQAFLFANRLHASQVRKKTTIPYVSHLLGVASIALEHGADEDEAIAALLHDAIEDGGGPPVRAEIEHRFGHRVAEIVEGCTDTDVEPKPPFHERKRAHIEHLGQTSPSTRLVSASDKLHNARAILADYRALGEALWGRFNGGRDGTLWYYRSLVTAFRETGAPLALVEELDRVVSEIERLACRRWSVPKASTGSPSARGSGRTEIPTHDRNRPER